MDAMAARRPVAELTAKELGREGERLCAEYLERRGYEIVERNWHCPVGEVDLIASEEAGSRVFVEVKTRLSLGGRSSLPEDSVDDEKLERYRGLMGAYLAEHPGIESARFDVAGIDVYGDDRAHIHYLQGIFLGDGR